MRGKLRDTRPGVAILDGGGFVPGIIADQLIAEDMQIAGKIDKRGSRLQIDVQDAKGDDLRIRGRLVSVPGDLRASFLVEALVNVGVSTIRPGRRARHGQERGRWRNQSSTSPALPPPRLAMVCWWSPVTRSSMISWPQPSNAVAVSDICPAVR